MVSWGGLGACWATVKPLFEALALGLSIAVSVYALLNWIRVFRDRSRKLRSRRAQFCLACSSPDPDPGKCPFKPDHRPSDCQMRRRRHGGGEHTPV